MNKLDSIENQNSNSLVDGKGGKINLILNINKQINSSKEKEKLSNDANSKSYKSYKSYSK